jgi:hypothetical protein
MQCAALVEPDVEEVADVQRVSARYADHGYGTPVAWQSSRTRSSADPPGHHRPRVRVAEQRLERVEVDIPGPVEQPFRGRADEDVGQLPLGIEVAQLREPAELAVLDSPPIGRFEASDSHGVIVTCFGSDDRE